MNKSLPIVALVGAPNAGKSTLLNKIAGEHLAVTSAVPGTTRDRQYAEVSWNKKDFLLVDTAGLQLEHTDDLEASIQEQIQVAVQEANLLVLVADFKSGATAIDRQVLLAFRKSKLPKILAVNKVDSPKAFATATVDFAKWGIKNSIAVSGLTGRGVGDLLDAITEVLPERKNERKDIDDIKIALIGKPNVGKSSIFNSWVGSKRVVVSNVPGTTRTAIDTRIKVGDQDFTIIDTAGLKKKSRKQPEPDVFSGFQTFKSIRKSDVSILVIDALEPITKQDQALAREIFDQEKGCILAVNKIDELDLDPVNKNSGSRKYDEKIKALHALVSANFPFLWMCPVFFVSAETKEGLQDLLDAAVSIHKARHATFEQTELDDLLAQKLKVDPPRRLKDQKKPKVYSLHQVDANPPFFELKVNHPRAISENFRRSLMKVLTQQLNLWGTPLRLQFVKKLGEEKIDIEKS